MKDIPAFTTWYEDVRGIGAMLSFGALVATAFSTLSFRVSYAMEGALEHSEGTRAIVEHFLELMLGTSEALYGE